MCCCLFPKQHIAQLLFWFFCSSKLDHANSHLLYMDWMQVTQTTPPQKIWMIPSRSSCTLHPLFFCVSSHSNLIISHPFSTASHMWMCYLELHIVKGRKEGHWIDSCRSDSAVFFLSPAICRKILSCIFLSPLSSFLILLFLFSFAPLLVSF